MHAHGTYDDEGIFYVQRKQYEGRMCLITYFLTLPCAPYTYTLGT